jgi:hypothetical protein
MPQALDDTASLALQQAFRAMDRWVRYCVFDHIDAKIREFARAPKALPHFQPGATPQANAFPAK